MSSHHPQFLVDDALYCEELHWDNHQGDGDGDGDEEGDGSITCSLLTNHHNINHNNDSNNLYHNSNSPYLDLLQQNIWEDDEELASLLHKEQENQPHTNLEHDPSLNEARADAVEWMLKVVHYYSFSALTAVLAVNYLDRFLHSFNSHGEKKPWMTQLAAVACISLAAKVEETHVPLLLDLQVEESDYVFESKTIQRMEILVLSTLQWRMNPVTPFSFLDCIATKLGFCSNISREFLRRCHCLLLSLLSESRVMRRYLPSALATATMLYVISSVEPTLAVEHHHQLIGILGINKEEVENCCRIIQEAATSGGVPSKRRMVGPGSPKGVVDVCFSSDDSSAASSPEPLSKKFKSK